MLECEEQKYLEKRERIYNFLLMSSSLEKVISRWDDHAKDTDSFTWFSLNENQVNCLSLKQSFGHPRGTTVVDEASNYLQLHSNKRIQISTPSSSNRSHAFAWSDNDTCLFGWRSPHVVDFLFTVYALWVLSMFGYISLRMDIPTNTYYTCSHAWHQEFLSISNRQTVGWTANGDRLRLPNCSVF